MTYDPNVSGPWSDSDEMPPGSPPRSTPPPRIAELTDNDIEILLRLEGTEEGREFAERLAARVKAESVDPAASDWIYVQPFVPWWKRLGRPRVTRFRKGRRNA